MSKRTDIQTVEVLLVKRMEYFNKDVSDLDKMKVDWEIRKYSRITNPKLYFQDFDDLDALLLNYDIHGLTTVDGDNDGKYEATDELKQEILGILTLDNLVIPSFDHIRILYKNGWCGIIRDFGKETNVWRKNKNNVVIWDRG